MFQLVLSCKCGKTGPVWSSSVSLCQHGVKGAAAVLPHLSRRLTNLSQWNKIKSNIKCVTNARAPLKMTLREPAQITAADLLCYFQRGGGFKSRDLNIHIFTPILHRKEPEAYFGFVRLSHYREHDISGMPWGNSFKFWYRYVLGLKDEVIRFWWSMVKSQSRNTLTAHVFHLLNTISVEHLKGTPWNMAQTSTWAQGWSDPNLMSEVGSCRALWLRNRKEIKTIFPEMLPVDRGIRHTTTCSNSKAAL